MFLNELHLYQERKEDFSNGFRDRYFIYNVNSMDFVGALIKINPTLKEETLLDLDITIGSKTSN